jgi:hypothetical protein
MIEDNMDIKFCWLVGVMNNILGRIINRDDSLWLDSNSSCLQCSYFQEEKPSVILAGFY